LVNARCGSIVPKPMTVGELTMASTFAFVVKDAEPVLDRATSRGATSLSGPRKKLVRPPGCSKSGKPASRFSDQAQLCHHT
jgi:hypothetical protein